MGKQNIQAKEVYCSLLSYDGYLTLDQIFVFDWPTDFAPQFFYKPNPPFNYVIGHKFIDSSMNRRSDRLSDRLTVSLSDWLAHWLSETNDCLADWLIVWLIDWFIYLKVIGDSSGLVTSTKLLTNKGNFSVLREVEAVVKIPLKFIHVITNPFDDIASIVTKQSQQGKKVLSSFDIR